MQTTKNAFGQFFRNRRIALGLNLSEFCRQNGFDKGNVSRLERGIKKPPESPDLLQDFASALKLQPDSEDQKNFMRHAAIALGKLPSDLSENRTIDVEAMFKRLGRRLHEPWVKARNLEQWSLTLEAQAYLPKMIRLLIYVSTEQSTRIEMPSGEGVQRHGWDGIVNAESKSPFVPFGVSGWEISVDQRPADKAERDFRARTKDSLGLPLSETTFVFVTSRKWDGKNRWRDEKRKLGKWKDVVVYDSSDLEGWLEISPGVDAWIAERLGQRPAGVISISDYWESLSRLCEPRLKPDVFITSREKTADKLGAFFRASPSVMPVQCRSPIEALDFVAAYLEMSKSDVTEFAMDDDDRIRTQSRTVVVKDRPQWDGLSQATGQLNLIPLPSLALTGEELNSAVSRGHHVLIAATHFSNHRLQPVTLPRPSRYDLEEALRKSGFKRDVAVKAARAAGGSVSVLKRNISTIPIVQSPSWCRETELADFMAFLLAGAWDDTNEADRKVLSELSGRPYGEVQNIATRVAQFEESPLTRIESRWRLVSPEDAWSLTGKHVTDDLLVSFETIAIEILGKSGSTASAFLRRGISETIAILGAGFGLDVNLHGVGDRAASIVRTVLQSAPWQRWEALGDLLPLLAEAAPEVFLNAIGADLKRKQPELAKLLADGGENAFLSRCKHAGLLWAIEGLAWSPELLPIVCTTLAQLDLIDTGRTWGGNRPFASLCEILLPWHPQTAAGVDQRIGILKSLADRTPETAWKLLFTMMPQQLTSANLTHRPTWRDWACVLWKETSSAEYWKQVNVAAELIAQLIGNDPSRWSTALDKLQSIPEPYRDQLIARLQSFPVDKIGPEERRILAEKLRKIIQRHWDYADAWWALPAAAVAQLEQALPALLPDGLCERHAWLFVQWLELEGFDDDEVRAEAESVRLRTNALREIIDHHGFDGVLKLADLAESPEQIGSTIALANLIPVKQILPGLLRSSDTKHKRLAGAYVSDRIFRAGWDWVCSLGLDKWDVKDAAALLSQAGIGPQAWKLAESLGREVYEEYWHAVPAYNVSGLDQQQLEFACQRLIAADRPENAVGILSRVPSGKATPSPSVVMDALAAFATHRHAIPDERYLDGTLTTIQRLFGWLQQIEFKSDEPMQRLARLEWAYLSLLDGFAASPKTLVRILSEDPTFFAQLIELIFGSHVERESGAESTDEVKNRASNAYRLLMNWNRIPGAQSDGSINEEKLMHWLESARSLCRSSGNLESADSQIGEMLGRSPQPENDGTKWPCDQICDAIEEADSDDLDIGFQIGILNSRGATTRLPLDGGDLERKEAAKYRRWAELCDIDWPRTAASLRKVAENYEFSAQREDSRAAERAYDRH
jgi:transcriptional regulator with XRE-family HTH domain